jgi:signal peptidase II
MAERAAPARVDGADEADELDEADKAGGLDDDDTDAAHDPGARRAPWRGPSPARWALFAGIAVGVLVLDQLAKSWIVANLDVGEGFRILGDWLRVVYVRNSGILFGMLPQSAGAFAIVSLVVVGLIVAYHARAGRGIVITIALGLLLGGALGNLVDRLRYGSVVDFVDMGIGAWRFYTYNVADAAISTAIVLLIALAVVPRIGEWGAGR